MGRAKGEDELRDARAETATELQRSGTRRAKRRGRRGRGSRSPVSGEVEVELAPSSDSLEEASGQRDVAVSFIETVSDQPVADPSRHPEISANSNHRADIVLAAEVQRAFADAPPVRPIPEATVEADPEVTASVLDAPYSLRPSAPPRGASVWPMRLWVATMCSIIAAAGWVALREHRRAGTSAGSQASSVASPEPAQSRGEPEVAIDRASSEGPHGSVEGTVEPRPVSASEAAERENPGDEPRKLKQEQSAPPPEPTAPENELPAKAKPRDAVDPEHAEAEPSRAHRGHRAPPTAAVDETSRALETKRAVADPHPSAREPFDSTSKDSAGSPLPQNPYESDVVAEGR